MYINTFLECLNIKIFLVGGLRWNRTTDTRIFNPCFYSYFALNKAFIGILSDDFMMTF